MVILSCDILVYLIYLMAVLSAVFLSFHLMKWYTGFSMARSANFASCPTIWFRGKILPASWPHRKYCLPRGLCTFLRFPSVALSLFANHSIRIPSAGKQFLPRSTCHAACRESHLIIITKQIRSWVRIRSESHVCPLVCELRKWLSISLRIDRSVGRSDYSWE